MRRMGMATTTAGAPGELPFCTRSGAPPRPPHAPLHECKLEGQPRRPAPPRCRYLRLPQRLQGGSRPAGSSVCASRGGAIMIVRAWWPGSCQGDRKCLAGATVAKPWAWPPRGPTGRPGMAGADPVGWGWGLEVGWAGEGAPCWQPRFLPPPCPPPPQCPRWLQRRRSRRVADTERTQGLAGEGGVGPADDQALLAPTDASSPLDLCHTPSDSNGRGTGSSPVGWCVKDIVSMSAANPGG